MVKSAMTPSFSGRMAVMLPGRAAEHVLGLGAHRLHGLAAAAWLVANGDHGGLVEDDALPAHIDKSVGRPEIDRQIVREVAQQLLQHACNSVRTRQPVCGLSNP